MVSLVYLDKTCWPCVAPLLRELYVDQSRLQPDIYASNVEFGVASDMLYGVGVSDGGVLVGCAVGCIVTDGRRDRTAMLSYLYLYPQYRGKGLGRYLLDGYISVSRQFGCTRLCLDVVVGNDRALGLYNSYGMKPYAVCMSCGI